MTPEREKQLVDLIDKAYQLISENENLIIYETRPNERGRMQYEIARWRQVVARAEEELGGGPVLTHEEERKFRRWLGRPDEEQRARALPVPPEAPRVFGGREKQLAELKERLRQGQGQAVGVTAVQGLGGIGKTTLAYQAANELFDEGHFKAVLHASLGREANALTLLTGWASLVEPNFTAGDVPLPQLATRIKSLLQDLINQEGGGGPVLIVLDDIWEKSLGVARLLLQAAPTPNTTLLTSRAAKVVTDLGAKQRISLERLSREEGVALLKEYLPAVDDDLLGQLSEVLRGYTLAVVLAAKRALDDDPDKPEAVLPRHIAQYAAALKEGTPFGKLELERGEEKEDNLTVTLYHSYADLGEEEQAALRALGVLAYDEPFDEPMLAALWQLDEEATRQRAKRLRLLSLIQSEGQVVEGENWYSQHPVLHSYARALLRQDSAEYAEALARYEEHIIGVAEQFDTLKPWEWQPLTPYLPHVHTVGAGLVQQYEAAKPEPAEELALRASAFANNITRYLEYRQEVREVQWLHLGLEAARQLQLRQHERLFLVSLGFFYNNVGSKPEALRYLEQSLAICQELNDQLNKAISLTNIGGVYNDLGEKEQALDYFQQALLIHRAVGDRTGEAVNLNNIGGVYDDLGEKEQALDYYRQALPIRRAVGDRAGEANTLNNIGSVYRDLGEKEQALDYYRQALPIQRAVGDRAREATTCFNIGMVYWNLGQVEEAIQYVERCVQLDEEIKHPDLESDRAVLAQMRQIVERQGNVGAKRRYWLRRIKIEF